MVINFNPKYIPGDIVYNHKKEIIRITSSYLKGTKLFYYRDGECGWIREDAIKPIPITPELLEKNGWEKKAMSRGISDRHLVYTKPDIEEYGYFPIYIEKVSVMSLMYIRLLTTMYVNKLHTLSMFTNSSTFSLV